MLICSKKLGLALDTIRIVISRGRLLLIDACPLLFHLHLGGVIRIVTAAGYEPVDEVGRKVCADEPKPPQGSKSEGHEQCGPKDDAGHTDPEQREYDGGKQGESDGAEDEGGKEEDRDEGEEELGYNEGLQHIQWSAGCSRGVHVGEGRGG